MKKTLFLAMMLACLFACRRQETFIRADLISEFQLRRQLADSMSAEALSRLDFRGRVITTPDSGQNYIIRVPYTGELMKAHFLIIKINRSGRILAAGDVSVLKTDGTAAWKFYGSLVLKSLGGELILQSPVANGYVMAWHQQSAAERSVFPTPLPDPVYSSLPDVVVVGYSNSGGLPVSDFLNLQALFGGGSGRSGFGSPLSGGLVTGGGGGGSSWYAPLDPYPLGSYINPFELEPELIYNQPVVDVAKLFKCFDAVPSAGATYSITLCADIPVNTNPYFSGIGVSGSSAGHSFLIVTKTNGTASVTQSFGFYPLRTPSFFDPFGAVPGGVFDNRSSEINASISMSINESQFNTVRSFSIANANQNYLLDANNCANYALSIFNLSRSNPISVSPLKVYLANTDPYSLTSAPTATFIRTSPQMIFVKLQEMKNTGGAESSTIVIDKSHNYRAPVSHGECN